MQNYNSNNQNDQSSSNSSYRNVKASNNSYSDQDKRSDRKFNDTKRADKSKVGDQMHMNHHDKFKNQGGYSNSKSRDHRGNDRGNHGRRQYSHNQHGANNRFSKNSYNSAPHTDALKNIKPKRIETVEDIQADIERIEKDIQFEIKQIKAVKLGL